MSDPESKKKIVLLIDDDQFLLNMYSAKFAKSGFQVETANSGNAAIKKLFEGLAPSAILCDLVMPSMDGLSIIKEIKAKKLAEKSAVIVLSNQSQAPEMEKAKELAVDGYIVKASTIPSEVVEEVKKILSKAAK